MKMYIKNNRQPEAKACYYRQAGKRAVILEVRGFWMDAAEAWKRAACIALQAEWQQFALQRAEHYHRRSRSRM